MHLVVADGGGDRGSGLSARVLIGFHSAIAQNHVAGIFAAVCVCFLCVQVIFGLRGTHPASRPRERKQQGQSKSSKQRAESRGSGIERSKRREGMAGIFAAVFFPSGCGLVRADGAMSACSIPSGGDGGGGDGPPGPGAGSPGPPVDPQGLAGPPANALKLQVVTLAVLGEATETYLEVDARRVWDNFRCYVYDGFLLGSVVLQRARGAGGIALQRDQVPVIKAPAEWYGEYSQIGGLSPGLL